MEAAPAAGADGGSVVRSQTQELVERILGKVEVVVKDTDTKRRTTFKSAEQITDARVVRCVRTGVAKLFEEAGLEAAMYRTGWGGVQRTLLASLLFQDGNLQGVSVKFCIINLNGVGKDIGFGTSVWMSSEQYVSL
jgi:hypothetical protein